MNSARVVAAAIDARYPHATIVGSSLYCSRCGAEGKAPLPKDPTYNATVESWLHLHRRCSGEAA